MALRVPWGSSPGRSDADDGLQGVTKAALGLARIRKREVVEFAARLCEVLRKHDVAIPQDLADAVSREHQGQLLILSLDDHQPVLEQAALLLWIVSWDSRDMRRRRRPLKLDLAWDLLKCVATDCPVGYARALATGEMTLLACDLDRIQSLDSTLCAQQTIAAIDGIWADALDLSGGRWTIDSAATLFALESIPLQGWMIVKVISMDEVSEASLTRFVNDMAAKVRGLRQVDRPPGTDHVIQNYLDFVDSGLRKEIPLLVPTVADKREIDVLVRGLLERLTASDELQRSVFGHNCKTVKLLWCLGSLQSGEVKIAFEGHGADGKVSRVVGDRSIRRTQAGIRWD